MYASGRGDTAARRLSRGWSWVFSMGLMPRRWVTLEVRGHRSGELRRFPLGMADVDGRWYLVSMLGECAWVRNVRSAGGQVVLRRRRRYPCLLEEVPVDERGPILKRYVEKVPGGRPHIPVGKESPPESFRRVAGAHPVFLVTPREPSTWS
ncbi:MAG: nitroreductase family deazaflavin-dependent oxidoreductase [Actinobacteria bacterium]|nr:nitroreductase family deazaflavin-dependent oxidoreductase [Actinomycetota bacterium]NIS34715.1 nitroreductase family deazaflavin-dependent oxidoreductase [Actinomycetota bacterium]NIT94592.1 nitroreductase family deazaflavin-dependent oxidoreductase [Actinomycetota bacterium]NIU18204.1 nitroreductase family deazaflavin-dependent oxidoreductase [Actinomycetota bacterium]NIU69473.1 nitroreductase family deazaflavin-dependent oxidoreductase [Actinomycetota bacterium]